MDHEDCADGKGKWIDFNKNSNPHSKLVCKGY